MKSNVRPGEKFGLETIRDPAHIFRLARVLNDLKIKDINYSIETLLMIIRVVYKRGTKPDSARNFQKSNKIQGAVWLSKFYVRTSPFQKNIISGPLKVKYSVEKVKFRSFLQMGEVHIRMMLVTKVFRKSLFRGHLRSLKIKNSNKLKINKLLLLLLLLLLIMFHFKP